MSEAKVTVLPIVNMNGSSAEVLIAQYRSALSYTKAAIGAASDAFPHGRDYQCNREEGAYETARFEYEVRVTKQLQGVADYLEALCMGILDQQ